VTTPDSNPVIAPPKYGLELTQREWRGLPLRVGQWQGAGKLEALTAHADTVLVWGGGRSDVTVDARREHAPVARHRFVRHSGMIDLMPEGTTIEQVEWRGQRSTCVSAVIPLFRARELSNQEAPGFDQEQGPRFGLVDAHVVDLVRRLEAQAIAGQPFGSMYVEALSLTLLTYLRGRYGRGSSAAPDTAALSARQRDRLIEFVEEHLGTNIGLPELAAIAGYSPDHFSRLFKRCFGQPPYQYVLMRRVERAKAMLKDQSRSIANIAAACGFATQAHLNSAFKLRTGVTPGVYRRG
jgi:AraC family transcriptional regulator